MNFRGKSSTGDLSGFLEVGCHLEGELRFEQSFRVDGKVKGNVVSDGDLVVGERGVVEGDVRVGRLYVSGLVQGEVYVSKRLSIHARGRVQGEVHAAALVIDEGGVLEGRCAMAEGEPAEARARDAAELLEDSPRAVKVVGRIKAS